MAEVSKSFVALLIDGDNISPTIIPALVNKCVTYGTLYTAVVCGDAHRLEEEGWKSCIQEFSMTVHKPCSMMTVFDYSRDSDTYRSMRNDASYLLHVSGFTAICIASTNFDPHAMASELREGISEHGAVVYTFGKRPRRIWPEEHRVNCVYFDELDVLPVTPAEPERPSHDLSSTTTGTPHQQPAASATVGATRHPTLALPRRSTLARPIDQATLEGLAMAIHYSPALQDGYRNLAPVGEFFRQVAKLDHRHYGYDRLRDMVEASGIANVKWPDLVRLKKDAAVKIKPLSAWIVADAPGE
ncbi:hypothetical protein LTR56_001908 [Elasticomyces elasticus]|nr:hypothetical protein LTR56_001908 [Elasticomyces elasticus]KAK3668741.1 hypothetical protein LTR22_000221 [Elasticomyces elasticus]KAK4930581.1 hypothetical protein LTR49_002995 [Elasticomyces elasticus]KAK5757900.1 hypothetical protein LTS12_011939 [Elasticomyces elasticus]